MRRRGHRRKSRCQGSRFAWRSHRCDCEAPRRGRTSPDRQKTPATWPNHSLRHHAPVPRPVAPVEGPTLVLRTMNSRGRYSRCYSPIGVNAPTRWQTWSSRPRIATPAIRVTVDDLNISVGMSALPRRMSDKLFQAMRYSDSIPRDHREEIFEAEFITRKEKRTEPPPQTNM